MIDFKDDFEQYLKHLDLVQKNEPEKYEFIKEVADSFKDIDLSKLIENVALSVEKHKTEYSKITSNAGKEVFLKEQIELYTYANHRFNRFGDYANEMFNKYQPVFIEALEYWKTEFQNLKALPPMNSKTDTKKYTAKHYLLAYLFECSAKGESYPIGNKKELERIGNERMGAGKGNRFYKVFNEVINKDLNAEKDLFEIGGEYWRKAVIELSKDPELVENYLQSKQL